jgi:hypothetical protein
MGGHGSGGRNSKRKLRDVQCARLDVHELARDGKLTLGKRGTLFGTIGYEVVGGPDAQRLVLDFPLRSASGERLAPVQQVISCYWRRAQSTLPHLVFHVPQVRRNHLPVHHGPPLGSVGASHRKTTRPAAMERSRYRAY